MDSIETGRHYQVTSFRIDGTPTVWIARVLQTHAYGEGIHRLIVTHAITDRRVLPFHESGGEIAATSSELAPLPDFLTPCP